MKKRSFWSCPSLEKIARCLTALSMVYTSENVADLSDKEG
jgi:hypothetical protein